MSAPIDTLAEAMREVEFRAYCWEDLHVHQHLPNNRHNPHCPHCLWLADQRRSPMACPCCGIADVRDTADGGWLCRRCGYSSKRPRLT